MKEKLATQKRDTKEHVRRERNHEETKGSGDLKATGRGGLRRNEPCQQLDLRLQPPDCRKEISVCL